jgi:butyryl-CoA dehydrogenase
MKNFDGRVAAVTGAASGIGRALARQLSARGAHLALADIDDDGLAETVKLCAGDAVQVTSCHLDVADRDAVHEWADEVAADHGSVNLIFNNAGVSLIASVQSMSYEDMDWLMGINFWGVVHGTKAFLPHLKAAGEGHVINVSSVFGLISLPTQSAYGAAKFAVRGFTDALRLELEMEGSGVSCTTVYPGGVKTSISRNARMDASAAAMVGSPEAAHTRFDRTALTTAERAAEVILGAVEHNRRRVLIGPDAKAFDLLSRLPAGVYQRLITKAAARGRRRQGA